MVEIQPTRQDFLRLGAAQRVVSVWTKLAADDVTAVGLYQQLCGQRDGTFLLESAEQGVWSRYSFVGVNCPTALAAKDSQTRWLGRPIDGLPTQGEPLEVLAESLRLLASDRQPGLPPFSSGLVGYLGYDMVRHIEQLPAPTADEAELPEMLLLLASDLAVLDHHRGEVWLIANAINFDGSAERIEIAYADACARVQQMAELLTRPRPTLTQPAVSAEQAESVQLSVTRQVSEQRFQQMVSQAQERIVAGDIFQVVPSQRFDVATELDALEIYRQLRATNPSPYLFLMRLNDGARSFAVVGSSPEPLLTVKDRVATTHPIAGTRPRGADAASDAQLERELLADEKERAEHLMLVDLGRNDLGRVCEPGSVQVTEFMNVHRYSTVMHLEASVQGELRPEVSALDATLACFPAGTLSGAPKVMAMRIIDQLEATRRGIYGGVVGYFDFAGNCDMAIAIRTAVLVDGVARVQAGAGVVADSEPAAEEAESRTKAATVINAIKRAQATRDVLSRQSGTVLDAIIAGVRADLAADQAALSVAELQSLAGQQPPALDPKPAFRATGLSVIAEVKRASPSAGALADIADPAELAAQYALGGAAAISVLTERRRFNGSLADLRQVRAQVDIPVLRKDFIVDEYQVWQARAAGADLVLLIVAALDDVKLRELHELVTELGMTALVEVHDEAEAQRAVELGAQVIGVNNRNLKTLEVDPTQFGRIARLLPAEVIKVAESGITNGTDAARFAAQGADVVLVGQALVTTHDPADAVHEMIEMADPARRNAR